MKTTVTKKSRLSTTNRIKARWAWFFVMPWLLVFLVFYVYPLFYGLYVSFTNYGLNKMDWVGLANYKKIFSDYAFWRSVIGTLGYAVIVIPLNIFLPLWIANTIRNHSNGFSNLTKVLIYLPGVLCSTALVIVWKFLLQPGTGLVSQLLAKIGITYFSVFDNAALSIPVLGLLIALTNLGTNLIIYCAAINGISQEYYDAAELDGASKSQQFWKITFPLLHPTNVYVLITGTIGALQIFEIPKLMTGGGPNFTSSTILLMIYDSAFGQNEFGYASAIGVVLFVVTAIIAAIQFRVTQKETVEY